MKDEQTMTDTARAERLRSKLSASRTAVLVIDVQNDFCSPGGGMDRDGADLNPVREMLPNLLALLDAARHAGAMVVHVRNSYSTTDNRYLSASFLDVASRRLSGDSLVRQPMCEWGTWGADDAPGCAPREDEPVVIKHRYSGFHQTDLEMLLRVRDIQTVVPCGVATNVCVESTTRDAFMRDFNVVFPRDASASYFPAAHEAALSTIGMHFGEITDVAEITRIWQDAVPGDSVLAADSLSAPA